MSGNELLGGAIGVTLLGLGVASVLAWIPHGRRLDRTLLLFGAWCSLYGARLMADQPAIVATLGIPERVSEYFDAFVTYAINVPVGMFIEAMIGPGWKYSVRRVWQLHALYAAVAIIGDLLLQRPEAMMPLNSPVVLLGLAAALPNFWIYRDRLSPTLRTRAFGVATAIMLLLVANENLSRPVLPDVNIETVGVFIFVITLGYGVVARSFTREAELRAVQRELETARRIQLSLLPRGVPRATGVDLAAHYLPMTAVAGDLYDMIELDPSRFGVLVADVSGHGVPAALVASMVKLAFTMQAGHAGDPGRVLTAMNRAIVQTVEGAFVTAVYAVIDSERRTMLVANAGHPSLMVGRGDGSVEEGSERGFMLGLTAEAAYANQEWQLRPGDRVLLYTDGITEAQNPRGQFLDGERLASWLSSADAGDAAAVAELLLRNLKGWRGASGFDDDVTFVVATVPGRDDARLESE